MKEQKTYKMRPILVYPVNKMLLENKHKVYLLLFYINCFCPCCIKKVTKAIVMAGGGGSILMLVLNSKDLFS